MDECKVETLASGSAGAEVTVMSVVFPVSSDSSFKFNRNWSSSFSIDLGLSSLMRNCFLFHHSFPISKLELMSNCSSSYSLTVVAGMTVFNGMGSLSPSKNLLFNGSCSRSRREDLATSPSVIEIASASTKTIVPVLVHPTQVLDEGEGIHQYRIRKRKARVALDSVLENLSGLGLNHIEFVVVTAVAVHRSVI